MAGTLVAGALSTGSASVNLNEIVRGTAKAWVNFADPTENTASTIRSAYNVSSITDIGKGIYDVNFLNPLSNDLYCVVATASQGSTATNAATANLLVEMKGTSTTYALKTPTAVRMCSVDNNQDAYFDSFSANVAVFGT